LDEVRIQSLTKEKEEMNRSSKTMVELIDELRIQKTGAEQKLQNIETQLDENRREMVELHNKLKEEQIKVIYIPTNFLNSRTSNLNYE